MTTTKTNNDKANMTITKPIIPRLGATATQVLHAALAYDTAGYPLKFNVICEGEWQLNKQTMKFEKCGVFHGVPVISRVEPDTFESWLLNEIASGCVTIGCGGSRNWWELHRATGSKIALV